MIEYNTLRAILGAFQVVIVYILWRNDIGYLWRFGLLMLASAAYNLAPSFPRSEDWQNFIQVPAFAILFGLTAAATLEFFAFLKRRTFVEERSALLGWAGTMGFVPVWIFWWWPGDDAYQNFMLIRQYALMWLAGSYLAAWIWLRAIRPIHAELKVADHGEFWGFWLIAGAAMASTTKWGAVWRFAQWQGAESVWRVVVAAVLIAQICICFAFCLNLWKWKASEADAAQVSLSGLPNLARFQQRRLLNP